LKNILLSGPSRAGKSTLAKKISEELHYSVIHVDEMVAAFQGAYPQLDIRLNWDRKKTAANLAPFLGHYLGVMSSSHGAAKGTPFVMEGGYLGYFNFEMILPILKAYGIEKLKDHFMLIGLVHNKKTAEEFFADFRKYDTQDDWTYYLDDDELREVSQEALPYSHSMTDYLTKYGFTLYDTSTEREAVLDQIIKDIKKA
jgi:hypothetical protein